MGTQALFDLELAGEASAWRLPTLSMFDIRGQTSKGLVENSPRAHSGYTNLM